MMAILYNVPLEHVEPVIPIRRGRGRPPILNKKPLQVEPVIPIRRGRGRPPILNKKPLLQAKLSTAIRRGRGRPPSLHKKALIQLEYGIHRGRGRPRKQQVPKPIIDLLPYHVFKKPRTKTRFGREISSDVPHQALELEDAKIEGSTHDSETSKPFVEGEASPSTPPNCMCYQPFPEIEIPGSVPDFDLCELDDDLISNFFEDIPDVSSCGGWCKFCRK